MKHTSGRVVHFLCLDKKLIINRSGNGYHMHRQANKQKLRTLATDQTRSERDPEITCSMVHLCPVPVISSHSEQVDDKSDDLLFHPRTYNNKR